MNGIGNTEKAILIIAAIIVAGLLCWAVITPFAVPAGNGSQVPAVTQNTSCILF